MVPTLKDRTLPPLVGDPLGCLAPGQGMCFFRILGPASSGQAGMVEKSCTKWLGALPGAPHCGGSDHGWLPDCYKDSLFRDVGGYLCPARELPAWDVPRHQALP